MKTTLRWLGLAFVLWWIVTAPAGAAATAHRIGNLATQAARSVATIIQNV